MSVKEKLSEKRRSAIQRLMEEMPQEIYDNVIAPAFYNISIKHPYEKKMKVVIELCEDDELVRAIKTIPEVNEILMPFCHCYVNGIEGCARKGLMKLIEMAEEFDMEASTFDEETKTVTFTMTLEDWYCYLNKHPICIMQVGWFLYYNIKC